MGLQGSLPKTPHEWLILYVHELPFPAFKNHLIIEPSGPSILLKNISLLMAKELYSANSKLGEPMPILSGSRLGPYEILSVIGAGGMGEV